jgi:hypothetical protein
MVHARRGCVTRASTEDALITHPHACARSNSARVFELGLAGRNSTKPIKPRFAREGRPGPGQAP